jgi:hypothetical protein
LALKAVLRAWMTLLPAVQISGIAPVPAWMHPIVKQIVAYV